MKHLKKLSAIIAATFLFSFALVSCSKDDNNNGSASTTFKVTDAPIDDANITGAFVTIADIKLDGVSVEGFTKTTVDLNAYQNGATKTIGTFNLEGKTYNSITFVLDYNTDVSGNTPGSYVLTTNGTKHKLSSSTTDITINKTFDLQSGTANNIVADFDLHKMIIRQSGSSTDEYEFATTSELQSSVRVVSESSTGTITGKLIDPVSASAKVVAYAYKTGTYNRSTEMQPQGTSGIEFKNAVSSSVVDANGVYQLHFLEAGNYEIHFASYKDTNADDELELKGTLIVIAAGNLDLLNLSVAANASVNMDVTATGVLN